MLVSKRSAQDPKLQWFPQARLGMFIHFGLYAILARGEHILRNERIPRQKYEKLLNKFNPHRFNPDAWIDAAEEMGARYITITTKHLDGFCLFDSKLTDYKITNTPYGRDLLGELAEACHRRRMRLCLYYSRAEWHHRNFVHDPDVRYSLPEQMLVDQRPDWPKYIEYFLGQLRELCTNYGKISGFWFDAYGPDFPGDPTPRQIYNMLKKLQPEAVVNDRIGFGDYFTPERNFPGDLTGYLYECCQALGMEWGYKKDCPLFSAESLIRSLAHCVGHGGNLLLNFGPKPDGTLPQDRLKLAGLIGKWVKNNSQAVYGTEAFQVKSDAGQKAATRNYSAEICATRKGKNIYVILLEWPKMSRFVINNFTEKPVNAKLSGYKGKIATRIEGGNLVVDGLPLLAPQTGANVLKLTFKKILKSPPRAISVHPIIELSKDGLTKLPPETARLTGRGKKGHLVRVTKEKDYNVFTSWTCPEQKATWKIKSDCAGLYNVAVVSRCPKSLAGSEYSVKLAKQRLKGKIASTPLISTTTRQPGDTFPFKEYKTKCQQLGIIKLSKGINSLSLQPGQLARMGYFAEILEVRLSKAKSIKGTKYDNGKE